MEASCWVARKIFLSAASASSRARTLDSRPTTNGVIINGKMTTSRMGIMGSFLDSNFSLDVVTQSPWDNSKLPALTILPCPEVSGYGTGDPQGPCRQRQASHYWAPLHVRPSGAKALVFTLTLTARLKP